MIIIDVHLKVISVAVFIVCLLWGKRQKDVFFIDHVLNLPNIVNYLRIKYIIDTEKIELLLIISIQI